MVSSVADTSPPLQFLKYRRHRIQQCLESERREIERARERQSKSGRRRTGGRARKEVKVTSAT